MIVIRFVFPGVGGGQSYRRLSVTVWHVSCFRVFSKVAYEYNQGQYRIEKIDYKTELFLTFSKSLESRPNKISPVPGASASVAD